MSDVKLTKQDVCVFIENEQQLQEAREMLERYNQTIQEDIFFISRRNAENNLLYYLPDEFGDWGLGRLFNMTQITLPELETILKEEYGSNR